MKWKFYDTGLNTGSFNMEYDVNLAQNSADDEVIFRLYGWEPYCISLGYHQPESDINLIKAEHDGIEIVRRPTGGRAILHSEELTYSIIFPTYAGISAKDIYSKVSKALISGLGYYDSRLELLSLESLQPDFAAILKNTSGSLCFASAAKDEVKFQHKKIIGSAQRKMQNRILQHGSIMCGDFHLKLPEYLAAEQETKSELLLELRRRTISIAEILGCEVDYSRLKRAIIKGVMNEFNIAFENLAELNTTVVN